MKPINELRQLSAVEFARRKIEKWIAIPSNRKSMQGKLYLVKDRDPCTRACPTWNQVLLTLFFKFKVRTKQCFDPWLKKWNESSSLHVIMNFQAGTKFPEHCFWNSIFRPSSAVIPDKEIKWIIRRTVAVSTLWFFANRKQ